MKLLTRQQIKNLQPHNLIILLNKYGITKTAELCGVCYRTIYDRMRRYKIVKKIVYKFSTDKDT